MGSTKQMVSQNHGSPMRNSHRWPAGGSNCEPYPNQSAKLMILLRIIRFVSPILHPCTGEFTNLATANTETVLRQCMYGSTLRKYVPEPAKVPLGTRLRDEQ